MIFGGKEMPFLEHLEELRWRLIKSIIALAIAATAAYAYSDNLFVILWHPIMVAMPGIKMHFFKVSEAFNTRIWLSLVGGGLLALPIILYQLWRFILPGLYQRELKIVYLIVIFSTIFFFMGVLFCYFWMLPYGLQFLLTQAPPDTEPTIMMGDYLSFILWTLMAFGLIFQMPIVAYILGRIGILTSSFMSSGRRYAIVIIAIAAAIITPQPDFISQSILGIPMYLLYELSILIVWLTGRSEPRHRKDLVG
jgi:sec-independent protein translocase protein TatC